MYKALDGKYEVLTLNISGGIITLLDEEGNLSYYKQKGIARMGRDRKERLIREGVLDREVDRFKALPSKYRLVWEDASVMGRPEDTFKIK